MKHSEIYKGKKLTCVVRLRTVDGHMMWECDVEGVHVANGSGPTAGAKLLPSTVLAEAIHAGRRAIDLAEFLN